jgi:hypothetical protein
VEHGWSDQNWCGWHNAAMAACTLKLLLEDLRAGSAMSIAMSLFFYGAVWVLLPKVIPKKGPTHAG